VPRELLWPVIEQSLYEKDRGEYAAGQIVDPVTYDQSKGEEMRDKAVERAAQIEARSHLVVIPSEILTAVSRSGLNENEITVLIERWGVKAKRLKGNAAKIHPLTTKPSFDVSGRKHGDVMIAVEEGALTKTKGVSSLASQGKKGKSDKNASTGGLTFPPLVFSSQNIVKAYQLKPDIDHGAKQVVNPDDLMCPEILSHLALFKSQFDFQKGQKSDNGGFSLKLRLPVAIKTFEEYLGRMAEVRDECDKCGLVPMYYYTKPSTANVIAHYGFSSAAATSKDGGVYFTALSPASYDVGTSEYEDHLILGMLGPGDLADSHGAHKFDVCIVYAAEPRVLRQAPGRHKSIKMVPKLLLEHLSEPDPKSGKFLLRPDRIVACFLLNPLDRLMGYNGCAAGLMAEKEKDKSLINKLAVMESVAHFNERLVKSEHGLREGREQWPRMDMVTAPTDSGLLSDTSAVEIALDHSSEMNLHSSYRSKLEQDSQSETTTEPMQLEEESNLGELTAFLAPAELESLVPRFASAGLLRMKQLLAIDREVYCVMMRLLTFIYYLRLFSGSYLNDSFFPLRS
jgi:hypothetical protein